MDRLRKTSKQTDSPKKAISVKSQRIFYGTIAILGTVALVVVVRIWLLQPSTAVSQPQTQPTLGVQDVPSAEGQAPSNPAATPVAALTDKDVRRITLADAKSLLDNGTAVLVDARSAKAYNSKHAAGAISFPDNEVVARFSELPADKVLIFYCT